METSKERCLRELLNEEMTIPENPSPLELQKLLIKCSNTIATLSEQIAIAREAQAKKTAIHKQEIAKARILNSGKGTVKMIESYVELDENVSRAKAEEQTATAYSELLQARLAGADAHFKALRKVAEVRINEMKTL